MAGTTKGRIDVISSHWNAYVALELGLETSFDDERKNIEAESLIEQYKKVKKVKITARKSRTEGIIVEGIKNLEKF